MARTITIQLTDEEEKILLNDLTDIEEWFRLAKEGKINSCAKRLAVAERERLIATGAKTVPATNDDLVKSAFANSGYKNRAERETEEAR